MSTSGYTPAFGSMLTGSLYGRWPHTGVWACLLSRVSRDGVIDEHPSALAAAIGIPIDDLKRCIDDFMQPDPESRSPEADGRRLELIDPARSWGWRVVNFSKYREKARKKAYDDERTTSGVDAARKRAEREGARDVPTRPDASRSHSHSHSHSHTQRESGDARASNCPDASCKTESSCGTADAGEVQTHMPTAEDVLAKLQNAWRGIDGCDHTAMIAWLEHWARVHNGRDMPDQQRIAAAKLLSGLGDADTQQRAVQSAEANGWKSLRHGDGHNPRTAKLDAARAACAESERAEWANLRERAARIGFRMPTNLDDVSGYRCLVEREESNQPRRTAGAPKSVKELLEVTT